MEKDYIEVVQEQIELLKQETSNVGDAADILQLVIEKQGLIYVFGCGHSHMFGEELFYRAGGLANIVPILYEPLMLHQGAAKSSCYEKQNDYIHNFINEYKITNNDCLIVISTSGRNPVPIDVALHGKEKGAKVITISSFEYPKREISRHKDHKYLNQIGIVNINNKVKYGDATMEKNGISHTPISTVAGLIILHQMLSIAIDNADVKMLPVFRSGNVSGTEEHNNKLLSEYQNQIPMLTKGLNI